MAMVLGWLSVAVTRTSRSNRLDALGAHAIGAQQLDRGGPPQQRVPRQEDVTHRARADPALDQVFADPARLALRPGGAQPRALGDGGARHHPGARQREQREQGGEHALQRVQRLERLGGVDLRRDAEVAIGAASARRPRRARRGSRDTASTLSPSRPAVAAAAMDVSG